jgi:hypothetical protein
MFFSVWTIDCDGYEQLASTYSRLSTAIGVARELSKEGFETSIEDMDGKKYIRFPMKNCGKMD